MHLKQIFTLKGAAVIFVAWMLITAPVAAAGMVHKGTGIVTDAGRSLQTFFTHL